MSRSTRDFTIDVLPADIEGSKMLSAKNHLISALLSEHFYVVSSKAQRKVPVPEGIKLDLPLDAIAVEAFRKETQLKLSTQLTPHTLSLFPDRKHSEVPSHMVIERGMHAKDVERGYKHPEDTDNRLVENKSIKVPHQTVESNGNLFYLRSPAVSADVAPLSKVLLETFEDSSGFTSSKKAKKSKKSGKKSKVAVDTTELQPAGAMSSEDEADVKSDRKSWKSSSARRNVQHKKFFYGFSNVTCRGMTLLLIILTSRPL